MDLEKNRNLHKSQNKSRKLCEMATRIISDDELRYRLLQFYEDIPPIVEATRPVLLAKLEAKNISQNVGDSQIFKEKKLEKRNETVQQRPEERGERTKSEKRPPQVNASDDSTKFQTLVFFDLEATGLPSQTLPPRITELSMIAVNVEHFAGWGQLLAIYNDSDELEQTTPRHSGQLALVHLTKYKNL